ncbi:tRNA glutamyl-Q(34) synthetase GluQRS [Salinisphaera sp. SPP-AMP-43]|uniref:tRNA glutamyl-Q(34) synthetase GluQRS n=1 Tax=Salinisphaera sp. SPP-AMP-43 TaxID=3121288 RepID=UPI003C6E670E
MSRVVGRYAPSPTGPLHFGSLIAALASFCQAKAQGGLWRLRIDDLDTPRVVAGADRAIIDTLAAFGLEHDGPVMYQSRRDGAYAEAIAELKQRALAFDCACTRREARSGPVGSEGPVYPGTCRHGLPPGRAARSVRLAVEAEIISVGDLIQGECRQNLSRDIGDFVIRRADGITAYQLATVIDDAAQGVTEVVRGSDLLSSTPRQIWIYRCLDIVAVPRYAHIPVVVDVHGDKLGKSTGALALEARQRAAQLTECLALLGQQPPAWLARQSVSSVIAWAVDHWQTAAVPQQMTCRRATGHEPQPGG